MTTKVLVAFYSTYGHIHRMDLAVVQGAEGVSDTTVRLRRIAELEEARKALAGQEAYVRAQQAQSDIPVVTHDDLRWADGIAWGTPTRYGNMSAPMKQFIDTTGGLWLKGELEDKATGIFTSTATIHGGQETTILTALVPLIHLGMVFVGTPYGQNPQILVTALVARPTDPAPSPEPTARDSRLKQSSQPRETSAVALLASRAVSKISGEARRHHSKRARCRSSFRGKADAFSRSPICPLMTQSGH
jgi:NAD(P)H dehydrogenase (quinone)